MCELGLDLLSSKIGNSIGLGLKIQPKISHKKTSTQITQKPLALVVFPHSISSGPFPVSRVILLRRRQFRVRRISA